MSRGLRKREWTHLEDVSLVHGYRSGEDMVEMSKRLEIGRSSLYRRLTKLGIPAREPKKRSGPAYYSIKPYENADPLVKQLFAKARRDYATLTWLAQRSGLCRETIGGWGKGLSPIAANLQAVGNVIGLELVWQRTDEP